VVYVCHVQRSPGLLGKCVLSALNQRGPGEAWCCFRAGVQLAAACYPDGDGTRLNAHLPYDELGDLRGDDEGHYA
jgi:hypothetical protein